MPLPNGETEAGPAHADGVQPAGLTGFRQTGRSGVNIPLAPAELTREIEQYLHKHPAAVVLERGQTLFDLRRARYSVADSHGRCVLQLWSDERNLVRTVVGIERRADSFRLMTRRMGATRPTALDLVPVGEKRTPTTQEAYRRQYLNLLDRALQRALPDWARDGFRTAADLENSFGPGYIRGRLLHGTMAAAVVAVGARESSAAIDGVLTTGLLWLDYCRKHSEAKGKRSRHYGALKIVVPAGAWLTTAERIAWLNSNAAEFQLFSLDERTEELKEIEIPPAGNLESRLTYAFDVAAALGRARAGVARVMDLLPAPAHSRVEVRARSAAEVALLLHGLEFARVRNVAVAHSFSREDEITFGAGANETVLTELTEPMARELFERLFRSRHPNGAHADPLFRLQPEKWLESRLRMSLETMFPSLRGEFLYSQVPATSSGERGMLDLLTVDRSGRLTIIEVKASEDMHLPLQALDYWIRVRALHARPQTDGNSSTGAFERNGYFPGVQISPLEPRLVMVAPALRIHPANEIVLRYISPQVEWELVAVSEHWRRELKAVFRKRGPDWAL